MFSWFTNIKTSNLVTSKRHPWIDITNQYPYPTLGTLTHITVGWLYTLRELVDCGILQFSRVCHSQETIKITSDEDECHLRLCKIIDQFCIWIMEKLSSKTIKLHLIHLLNPTISFSKQRSAEISNHPSIQADEKERSQGHKGIWHLTIILQNYWRKNSLRNCALFL